ncbi:MAG: TonB-dependent siderophore receptor, partial [Thermodesulfobacteriota bacterium]
FSGVGPFAGRGSFGLGQTQIRGIGSNFFTDRDEGFLSPIFAARPDLAPYERIEVLKGPSATLYGRSSAGGFVNRVRKKPLPEFGSEFAGSVGSFDFYRAEGDVTGPLFESDGARGRLVLAYEDAGAFVDGVESERVVLAPSLEFDLTDSTRLLLQGTYQKDDFLPNPGFPLVRDGDTFRAPNVRRSLYFGVPNEDEENTKILVGIAQLEQELGDDWLASLRLNRTATRQRAGAENYAYGITPEGDTTLFASRLNQDNDVWSGEICLNGNVELLGRPANVALGVDHTNFEFVNDQEYATLGIANLYEENFDDFPTQPTTPSFDGLDVQEGTGVYAQLQFRPFERLSVLLGGRYDWTDTSFENRLVSGSKVKKRVEAFSGRAGLTFDVTGQVSVYGLFAESFDPVTDPGANGQILDPETGEIYELGIKTEWLGRKLGITAAVFRLDRDNIPIAALTGPGEDPFSISAGLQRSDGIELEINGEPLPGWNVSFGGVLLDSEFKDGPFVGSLPGGTADWQVGLFTSYELQGGPLNGLGFGVGLFAIDERGASTFVPGATLEGYERVDLHAFYNGFKPLKIALQVRNVFDERYVEGADRLSFAQFGSPTAVLLTVRYDFE